MEILHIDRVKTFFQNSFIEDYYNTSKFDSLRSYNPRIEELGKAIEAKMSFSQTQRNVLAESLTQQYKDAQITIGENLHHNIGSLRESNTFTVTTGQQIHIGLGPMYVLYKALDVLAIAKQCKEAYPDYNFVPVFWMASEDHDLEEISEINLFGKKLIWKTNQIGPVGRMNPDGLVDFFEEIEKDFNLSEEQSSFIEICKKVYSNSENLSIAFRNLLHEYFKTTDLVILDADNKQLKESFVPVLEDELNQKNYESLEASTKEFESKGYKRQLVIRPCNLFDMSNGSRLKITDGANLSAQENAYSLSPNAALRPFYQEWILPNLVYVGGPSEVKYWMQLKGIFDNYKMPMPILHLRTSNMLIPKKQISKLDQKDIFSLFSSKEELAKQYDKETEILAANLNNKYLAIVNAIDGYSQVTSSKFNGFSLEGKIKKINPKPVNNAPIKNAICLFCSSICPV